MLILSVRLGVPLGWREAHHGYFCVCAATLLVFRKTKPIEGDFVDAAMFMHFEYNGECQEKRGDARRKWRSLLG